MAVAVLLYREELKSMTGKLLSVGSCRSVCNLGLLENPIRRVHYALLFFVLVVLTQSVLASTFYVGTCKAGAFSTISAAVAAVPADSTVDVCPGTYAEQVKITQSLTLQGISSGGSSEVVITIPGGGLTTTSSVFFGPSVAPQLWVTAGPVSIRNIVVDGTGGGCPGSGWLLGIFYASGSSGIINEVTVRNQTGSRCGLGIDAENGGGTLESITIENSSVHDVDGQGINAFDNVDATIKSNYAAGGAAGIVFSAAAGSVINNVASGTSEGMGIQGAPSVVSGNIVENSGVGMRIGTTAPVKLNKILNSSTYGIQLFISGVTVESNTIIKSGSAIRFGCNSGTVSSNTINDAAIGLDNVPTALVAPNTFLSVATVRTGGC